MLCLRPSPDLVAGRSGYRTEVLGQRTGVKDPGDAKRPAKGTTPLRQREASRIRMHMCSPTRQSTGRIGHEAVASLTGDRDNPQQLSGRRTLPATHTSTYRPRTSYQRKVYP
ncbi:hypothetical protein Pa4123_56650 [Phytohabitans aurantiacus]|uniref:Uncharacterized protein n=1 Tax=Phytohabitans aurantiacus TaxID=3016789 RepID=A0ABQ5R0Q0_9ACTN|nr:hypothetical protein Pa4123_56650 [Phytohabitans aurantiacus]